MWQIILDKNSLWPYAWIVKAKKKPGQPKMFQPCTFCRRKMGAYERRLHEPQCEKNPNRKAA